MPVPIGPNPDAPGVAGLLVVAPGDVGNTKDTKDTKEIPLGALCTLRPLCLAKAAVSAVPPFGEVARSSAALVLALVPGGSGLSL